MTSLLIFLFLCVLPGLIAMVIGFSAWVITCSQLTTLIGSCATPPGTSSASDGKFRMMRKLEEPYVKPGSRFYSVDDKELEQHGIYAGDIYSDLSNFFRLCHRTGLEIVIRPKPGAQGDTEQDPQQTDRRLQKLHKYYKQGLKRHLF